MDISDVGQGHMTQIQDNHVMIVSKYGNEVN